MPSNAIVQKLWNYCNILRDDGLSYGDYVEQLTFLLFLKMADEQSRPPFNKPSPIPKDFDWQSLLKRDGDELETHYPMFWNRWAKRGECSASSFAKRRTRFRTRRSLDV
jgi:HsdM N-terminal domain